MAWDPDRLADLRRKYGEAHGGEVFDPDYRRVAERIFSASGTRLAPYAGVPTFLSAPYRPVDAQDPDFGDLQVALVGMPMDLGVTNRTGLPLRPARAAHDRAHRPLQSCARHARRCRICGSPTSATCRFASRYRLELQP